MTAAPPLEPQSRVVAHHDVTSRQLDAETVILHLGSGRYYVEHLLFFVHYHSFFFLAGFVVVLLDPLGGWLGESMAGSAARFVDGALTVVLVAYLPYYLYRAMRSVYGQGRLVTLVKFSLLGVGYVFFLALTALGLLVYTMLTL